MPQCPSAPPPRALLTCSDPALPLLFCALLPLLPPLPFLLSMQMMDILMGLFVATGGLFGLLSMIHTFALNAAGQKRMW